MRTLQNSFKAIFGLELNDMTNEVKALWSKFDLFVDYIEDGSQRREAEANNNNIILDVASALEGNKNQPKAVDFKTKLFYNYFLKDLESQTPEIKNLWKLHDERELTSHDFRLCEELKPKNQKIVDEILDLMYP